MVIVNLSALLMHGEREMPCLESITCFYTNNWIQQGTIISIIVLIVLVTSDVYNLKVIIQ